MAVQKEIWGDSPNVTTIKDQVMDILGSLYRSKTGLIGVIIILLICFVALAAPFIAPYDPQFQSLEARLLPPMWVAGGSPNHILGTDHLGRDILSRLIYGSRISMIIGLSVVFISGTIGILLGLLSGYYEAWFSTLVMRLADLQLAFPFVLMAITIIAVLGGGLVNVIIAMSIAGWMGYARLIRGQTLAEKQKDYITAARVLGASDMRIIFLYILPNVLNHAIVLGTFAVANTMLTEAGLTYLGLGVEPGIPSWGGMLSDGRAYLVTGWWVSTFPGLAIMLTVMAVNAIGDWLRDRFDPHIED